MDKNAIQENWHALIDATNPSHVGEYSKDINYLARVKLASMLREYAQAVEDDNNPYVFGFYEVKNDGPFDEIRVVLSRPWGG